MYVKGLPMCLTLQQGIVAMVGWCYSYYYKNKL